MAEDSYIMGVSDPQVSEFLYFSIPVSSPSSLFRLSLILSCHFLGLTWTWKSILRWQKSERFSPKVVFMWPVKCLATG